MKIPYKHSEYKNLSLRKRRVFYLGEGRKYYLEIAWHHGRNTLCAEINLNGNTHIGIGPRKNWEQFFGDDWRQLLGEVRLWIAEKENPKIKTVRERITGKIDQQRMEDGMKKVAAALWLRDP